jgi:hypothetical protein
VATLLAGVVVALAESIRHLARKRRQAEANSPAPKVVRTEEDQALARQREIHDLLKRLFEMHNVRDQDGVYRWWFPSSTRDHQIQVEARLEEILMRLRDVGHSQERIEQRPKNDQSTNG